jgi:hypothetical protein
MRQNYQPVVIWFLCSTVTYITGHCTRKNRYASRWLRPVQKWSPLTDQLQPPEPVFDKSETHSISRHKDKVPSRKPDRSMHWLTGSACISGPRRALRSIWRTSLTPPLNIHLAKATS